MIHTACFFKSDFHKGILYSIANTSPPYIMDKIAGTVPVLVPPKSIVFDYKEKRIDWDEYVKLYNEFLNKIITDVELKDFTIFNQECTLLCWEHTTEFCHRRLAVEWLATKGFEIGDIN